LTIGIKKKLSHGAGAKLLTQSRFSVSEVMTWMLAAEYIPYPSERQYLSYIRTHHSDLFPDLLTQSQFNRRSRGLRDLVERMRCDWLLDLEVGHTKTYLLDTEPLLVLGYKRSKNRSYRFGVLNIEDILTWCNHVKKPLVAVGKYFNLRQGDLICQ